MSSSSPPQEQQAHLSHEPQQNGHEPSSSHSSSHSSHQNGHAPQATQPEPVSHPRSPLILDTPDGLEYIAQLIRHHRRDFLLANLSQQAAIIRFLRQQLTTAYGGFADPHGDLLEDDDAIALGIAKVFYLYTDEEEQDEGEEVPVTVNATQRGDAHDSDQPEQEETAAAAAAVHFMEQEDCQMYEYLTHLRDHRPAARISPSPTPATNGGNGNSSTGKRPASKRKSTGSGINNNNDKAAHATSTGQSSDTSPHTGGKKSRRNMSNDSDGGASNLMWGTTEDTKTHQHAMATLPDRQAIFERATALLEKQRSVPDIPRGVTVRPSGRWQSQVYFHGASRYLGVYSDSNQAALAFIAAKQILSENTSKIKDAPKSAIDTWFVIVRDVVTFTVQQGAQKGQSLDSASEE